MTKKKKRIIIFAVEIVVLLIMLGVLWLVQKTTSGVKKVDLDEEEISTVIPETVKQNEAMKGYRNIALFGVDSTTGALTKNTRSDSIIIANINLDNGDVKLVSVYRDTYLNLSNDKYNKCNGAYQQGGPQQAIKMLNMNLDLDITDFVTVGFAGLSEAVDAVGGVYIEVDSAELEHINSYQQTMAEDLKCSYTPVTDTGYQLLNGLQATAYCRIRYTRGDDFKRAERQREVIKAVIDQARSLNLSSLTKIINNVLPNVYTSLKVEDILTLAGDLSKYQIVDEGGFPTEKMRVADTIGKKGSCVIPIDLESNVVWLHEFLFDDTEYQVSPELKSYSNKIIEETSPYLQSGK